MMINVAQSQETFAQHSARKNSLRSWQQDATGTQDFEYGNMGEMVSNVRTVVGPNIPTRVFKTAFQYDSWNRLQTMEYPDGEKIVYDYDLGGNLNKMTGVYSGMPYHYIKRIDYDYYEQRTYLLYGNKTQTFYNYTPALRRLNNLNVKTSDGNDLFNNKYAYDKVGNVLGLSNSAGVTANNMAGSYVHEFEYDNLNRLVGAQGSFDGSMTQIASGNDANSDYVLKMEYNDTHGIINKTQKHVKNGNAYLPNTYNNNYEYFPNTHQVKQIEDINTGDIEKFQHDANGNIITRTTNTSSRVFSWDESNRLRVVSDQNAMQHYIYDASGERVLKANSDVEALYQNGTLVNAPGTVSINGYTSYPSAFMVITADGVYSKHYYAGSQRIVSQLGATDASIFDANQPQPKTTSSQNQWDAKKLQQAQKADLQSYADKLKRGTIVYKEYKPISVAEQEKALADENEDKVAARPPSVYPMYYYHPDHLGTNTSLTDFNGNAYQFFLNLPFGETMAQQLGSNYYNSPYKFNSKELDEETGLYYYGARYFDPKGSIWLSTDVLFEKYPFASPYNYCLQNPINAIDPDGRDIIFIGLNCSAEFSIQTLQRTELGKQIWNKYKNSKTDDIYINVQTFNEQYKNTVAATLKHIGQCGGIDSKGRIKLPDTEELSPFSEFQGTDVSKSKKKGRRVHLISLNEKYFPDVADEDKLKEDEEYDLAESIFHEIVSHILLSNMNIQSNPLLEHKKYGHTYYRLENSKDPALDPNKYSGKIILQLMDLRARDKEKNTDKCDK